MFNGMVREQKEVKYILILKKNIIFVSTLEAKSYKVTIKDDTMKFMYWVMVILQRVQFYNLYYLKGVTTDKANVFEAHNETIKL